MANSNPFRVQIQFCTLLWLLLMVWCRLVDANPAYASQKNQTTIQQLNQVQRFTSKAGVPVIFYPAPEIPMLTVNLAFSAGSSFDGQLYGLSTLTTQLINQGNAGLDADAIVNQLAATGAQFQADNDRDMAVLHLKALTEPSALEPAIQSFIQISSQPDFPIHAFNREKNHLKTIIQHTLESPNDVANQTFFEALYQSHPYAHPVNGKSATVERITQKDVSNFYQQYFVRQNAILILVGAIDVKQATEIADQITLPLKNGKKAPSLPMAKAPLEPMNIEIPFKATQTVVRLGQLGINHHNPDYFPLMVGNYILGGGALVSRLALELRERRGLTYGITSQYLPLPKLGPFIIGFSTQSQQAKMATELTRKTLEQFIKQGVTNKELDAAKGYLIGSFPLSIASNQSLASILLKMAFYHLPDNYLATYPDKIAAVKASDIHKAFKKQLKPEQLLELTVGAS